MTVAKLVLLKAGPANHLALTWDDGHEAEVDLAEIIAGRKALKAISPARAFARAEISADGWSVEWSEGIDFGSTQLRRWADEQAGEAMPAADFRDWMEAHDLTLDRAAKELGLSRRMIAYYLSDEKPIPKTVMLATRGWSATQSPFAK